jgi:hypothetical protein
MRTVQHKSEEKLRLLFKDIVADNQVHAKFLNTLSLLENTGARKISASEDLEAVTLMVLKHAAEEHRHAFYLKKQIQKLQVESCYTYKKEDLLAPQSSLQYLNRLDVYTSKYLKRTLNLSGSKLRFAAYLLVTYAIELRADQLYPIYQEALYAALSKVSVKSIIFEEQGHLEEMILQLKEFSSDWQGHAKQIQKIEEELFYQWINHLNRSINDRN